MVAEGGFGGFLINYMLLCCISNQGEGTRVSDSQHSSAAGGQRSPDPTTIIIPDTKCPTFFSEPRLRETEVCCLLLSVVS